MAYEFSITRRVEFSETDMAGIMHFSNYLRFMEAAEHAFFRAIGFSVAMPDRQENLGLPRVHVECDYLAPLRFEDEVEVKLLVEKRSTRSISYRFVLRRLSPAPEVEAARGSLVVVCVRRQANGAFRAVALPKRLAAQIEVAPHSVLEQFATALPRKR